MIIHPYNSVTEGEPGLRGSPIYQEGGAQRVWVSIIHHLRVLILCVFLVALFFQ